MMRPWLIVVLLLSAAGTAAWWFWLRPPTQDSIVWESETLVTGDISTTVTATGTLEAITTVLVGTQVSGVIKSIYVDFNSRVKAGQLLAELDTSTLQAAVAEARANLENARNEESFQATSFDRLKELYDKKTVSRDDYEAALYSFNRAKTGVKIAQAQLDRAEINLGHAAIYSPIAGVILSRDVDRGQTVAASLNTPTLFTIANDLSKMQVEANIDEADIGRIRIGQRVEFSVDAFPDAIFDGEVTEIRLQPQVLQNVVTYTVIIDAPNPSLQLMPGMTASITAYVDERRDVLLLPGKALRFKPDRAALQEYRASLPDSLRRNPAAGRGDGRSRRRAGGGEDGGRADVTRVWIKDGVALRPRRVRLGLSDGVSTEVLEGLDEGMEVITGMSRGSETTAEKVSGNDAAQRSPFMPQRPGRRRR